MHTSWAKATAHQLGGGMDPEGCICTIANLVDLCMCMYGTYPTYGHHPPRVTSICGSDSPLGVALSTCGPFRGAKALKGGGHVAYQHI